MWAYAIDTDVTVLQHLDCITLLLEIVGNWTSVVLQSIHTHTLLLSFLSLLLPPKISKLLLLALFLQHMKHCQMKIDVENMTSLDMTKDGEAVGTLFNLPLTSISMICLKTSNSLVTTIVHSQRNILKAISADISRHTAGKDVLFKTFPLEGDFLTTCWKTWKKCFRSAGLTTCVSTQHGLQTNSRDLVSTAGLSLSVEETWSLHTQTVLDRNTLQCFVWFCFSAPYFCPLLADKGKRLF